MVQHQLFNFVVVGLCTALFQDLIHISFQKKLEF